MTYLMKVDGPGAVVRGGSTVKGREGWTEIASLSFDGPSSRRVLMGQGAVRAAPEKTAYITKNLDSATPSLARIASAGQIVRVTVEVTQPGITLTYVMKDCVLHHAQSGRSEEAIEVNFKSMSTGRATVAGA